MKLATAFHRFSFAKLRPLGGLAELQAKVRKLA